MWPARGSSHTARQFLWREGEGAGAAAEDLLLLCGDACGDQTFWRGAAAALFARIPGPHYGKTKTPTR